MSSRTRNFTTKDSELNRKLVQLEDSFFGEVDALKERASLSVPPPVLQAGYIARAGQLVRVLKPVELLMAKPKQDERGRQLVVWNGSGGIVTLRPIGSALDGLSSGILVGSGAFIHDGENWFSVSQANAKKTFIRAYVGTNQNFASGVNTRIAYDTEDFDSQSEWNPGTQMYTSTGYRRLRVYACILVAPAGAGELYILRILKNGGSAALKQFTTPDANTFVFDITDAIEAVPGTTIDVTLEEYGGVRTVTAGSALSYLTIEEVAS
jgi:hypothetical protein